MQKQYVIFNFGIKIGIRDFFYWIFKKMRVIWLLFNGLLTIFNERLKRVNPADVVGIWLQDGPKFLKDGRNVGKSADF